MSTPVPTSTKPAEASDSSEVIAAIASEPQPEQPAAKVGDDTARTAGRGGLAVAAAKIYFIIVGLVQQTLLARILGAEGYGALSRVLAFANVANNVVITSGVQGASRTVAAASAGQDAVAQRGVLKIHLGMALPLGALFFVIAPEIARRVGAEHVITPIRMMSLVVLGYTIYSPLIGALNGHRRFVAQASLDALYATLRTIGLIGGGWLMTKQGNGPMGSIAGFVVAALVIVPIAASVSGVGASGEAGKPKLSAYLVFIGPLALGQFFLNALMQSDIILLGYFAGQAGDTAAADTQVAIYRACQLFSFLPYQLLVSITFILFPMLAKAQADGDSAAIATYVRTGMRLAMLFGGAMIAVIVGLAPQVLHLTFKPEIAEPGGETLRMLSLGQGAFALLGIEAAVLSSLRREVWTMVLNAVATAMVAVICFVIVPGELIHGPMTLRVAIATSTALFGALTIGSILVKRAAGALVAPLSALRIGAAFALSAVAGSFLPNLGKVVTLVEAAAVGVVYLVLLVVSGEIGKDDLAMIKRVAKR
ncbi:MAG: oligosaccharide flippase family protein [Polyangiaceae bacterium]